MHHGGSFAQEDPALQEATASEPLTIEVRGAPEMLSSCNHPANNCSMPSCAWSLFCRGANSLHFQQASLIPTAQEEYEMQHSWACDSNSAL